MYSPKYQITNQMLFDIGAIDACREVIINAPLVPAYEKQFRDEAILRTVHHGTHIEGNDLSLAQAKQVLDLGATFIGRKRDVQEIINYRKVMDYLGSLKEKDISEEKVLHVHKLTTEKILEDGLVGKFRKSQVVVRNSLSGKISYTPPPYPEVPYLVEDFLVWLNSDNGQSVHTILRAGITHLKIAQIHPFVDGNGRVARAVATLVLYLGGYDIKKFCSLEEYYDKDAEKYYQALKAAEESDSKEGDLTFWLEYFIAGLKNELIRIRDKVRTLSVDVKLREKIGMQVALSERQIKLLEYIQAVGFIQAKSFGSVLPMVSQDTAIRDLNILVQLGVLQKRGSTKGARYVMRSD